jgi:beta-glucosidase
MVNRPIHLANKAADLVGKMSLEEKASLCSGQNFWQLKSIERLGLPRVMLTDGPHGLRKQAGDADHLGLNSSVPATCFPTAVALAASWDRDLLHEVGVALGQECNAEDVAVLLGPGVNIKRHPVAGRNFEYFSEDPLVSGECAAAMINGVQSQGVGTSLKHYAVNNREADRMVVDTIVDERTLREIYLTAFEIAVKKSAPWTLMCAYNRVNGSYCSEHEKLLNEILRDEWGFEGIVVTDWGAQNDRVKGLAAGLDLEMPGSAGVNDAKIVSAVASEVLDVEILDQAARRIVQVILASTNDVVDKGSVDLNVNHELAEKAALASMVLLKNDGDVLPFKKTGRLAVIGGFAEAPRYQGAGSSMVNPYRLDTAFDAFRDYLGLEGEVLYAEGFDPKSAELNTDLIDDAVRTARAADHVIVMGGLPSRFEAEGFDRQDLDMPQQINDLIDAVVAANPNTAVVLCNGAPVEMPWINKVPCVLEAHLAGQAGANALPRLIFGEVSPSGKLAETFPIAMADCPSDSWFRDHPKRVVYREGLNVGYRFFDTHDVPVLFPFGHGLSYASFEYEDLQISAVSEQEPVAFTLAVDITNTSAIEAAEVVQIYVGKSDSKIRRPAKELRDFGKVLLAPGQTKRLTFELEERAFSFYDVKSSDWRIESGAYEIHIGASVSDIRLTGTVTVEAQDAWGEQVPVGKELAISDAELTAMGTYVPDPEPVRPFHANSTLGDIRQTWLGARIHKVALKQSEDMIGSDGAPEIVALRDHVLEGMPLRNFVSMSNGAVSMKMLEVLIHALNGEYLAAGRRFFSGS